MDWDKFEDDKQILEYLSKLPRYKNSSLKSVINRCRFLFSLIYCHLFKIDKPLFIVLVTNNSCDFKCVYCYGNYGHRKGIPDFTTKELLKIIDELKEMGTTILTLHGGESLLRKDFGEILNYAKLKGFYVSLNSNGTLVPKRINELKCLDNLCISIDGNEESNDKNRGKGSFNKAMSALEIAKQNKIPIVVSATLTK
ncbi:MAG: radical SAM protein, partial [Planctomycetota bacterium]